MNAGEGAGEGWSVWPAPAKLNLFLRILGRRADGYHRLQTIFQLLDWGDRVRLRPRDDGRIHRPGQPAYGVAEADDLVVRAAKMLQSAAKITKGADIVVVLQHIDWDKVPRDTTKPENWLTDPSTW